MSTLRERPILLLIGTGFSALLLWGCATSGGLEKGGWVFEGDDVIVVQTEDTGVQEGTSAQEDAGGQEKTIRYVAQVLKRSEVAVDTADRRAGYLRTTPIPINDTLAARLNVVATDTSAVEIAGEFSGLTDEGGEWRRYAWNESLPRFTGVWSLMKDLATAIGSIEEYEEDPDGYGTVACGGRRCAEGQVCRSNVCRDEKDGSGESSRRPALAEAESCLTEDEQELLSHIRKYRTKNDLSRIPVSKSLTKVAKVHVRDLAHNEPHKEGWQCNGHSWSEQGDWTPCCYAPDHAEAECMWKKPRELTPYEGSGFEIASMGSASPRSILSGWQSSPAHNAVIINEGDWEDTQWEAVGVGIYDGYAAAWFGRKSPSEKSPPC